MAVNINNIKQCNESTPSTDATQTAINHTAASFTDFFFNEEPATHVEIDEYGNETIVEDGTTKTLNWFRVGATSTGIAGFIILLVWLFKKRH